MLLSNISVIMTHNRNIFLRVIIFACTFLIFTGQLFITSNKAIKGCCMAISHMLAFDLTFLIITFSISSYFEVDTFQK